MLLELEAKSTGQNQGRSRLNAVSVDCEGRTGFDACFAGAKELHRRATQGFKARTLIPTSTDTVGVDNTVQLPRLCFSERLNSRAIPDIRAVALANDSRSDRASHRSSKRSTRLDRQQSTRCGQSCELMTTRKRALEYALRDSWTPAVELLAETFAQQYRPVTTEIVAFLRGQRVHGYSLAGADKDCVERQSASVATPVRQ
jgi:hypothetical protein